MAVYTQLSNETIAGFLAQDYGLAPLSFALGIAEGVENSNYIVAIKTGDTEQNYILTLYEKRVKTEELPFFLGLMRHLAAKGIACPQPLPRKDGQLVGMLEGKHAVVVTFMPGHSRTEHTAQDVGQVGQALGKLHDAARDFTLTRANALSLDGWQKLAAKLGNKLDTLEAGLTQLVGDELSFLQKNWPKDLPQGVIHADLFPDNVFFENDTLSGMIDFYFACTDALAYDIAITMNAWCFDGKNFNEGKSRALMVGYEKSRALTREEKDAMPMLLRGAALRFLLTRAHDLIFYEAGALVTPHDPMEYVMKLKWWIVNRGSCVVGGE